MWGIFACRARVGNENPEDTGVLFCESGEVDVPTSRNPTEVNETNKSQTKSINQGRAAPAAEKKGLFL